MINLRWLLLCFGLFFIHRAHAQTSCAAPHALTNADLPFSSPAFGIGELTTCGQGNNYINDDVVSPGNCGNSNENDEEYVFEFVATADVAVDIDLHYNTHAVALFVYRGCPSDATSHCVDRDTGGNPRQLAGITFEKDTAYYIMVSDNSGCGEFQLDITEIATGVGAHPVNPDVLTLPYSSSGFTTCGSVDYFDQGSLGMNGCGSSTECSYAQDEEHIFSLAGVTGQEITIDIPVNSLTIEATHDPGIYILDGYPNSPHTSVLAYDFTASGSIATFEANLVYEFTKTQTYYIMVGTKGSPNCATFDLTIATTALPITLKNFDAHLNNGKVELEWITLNETNNDYFTIERSKDGVEWEHVLQTKGAGNSKVPINYKEVDDNPIRGVSYYRLRQTDYDGHEEVFDLQVTPVRLEGELKIMVVPNPLEGESIGLQLAGLDNVSQASITIQDVFGKVVHLSNVVASEVQEGSVNVQLDQKLGSGTYVLKVHNGQGVGCQKIVVQ